MSTPTLFKPNTMTMDEKVQYIERLLKTKCETFHISFGMFQAKRGPLDFSTHGTVHTVKHENKAISRPADSISELFDKLIEDLETL